MEDKKNLMKYELDDLLRDHLPSHYVGRTSWPRDLSNIIYEFYDCDCKICFNEMRLCVNCETYFCVCGDCPRCSCMCMICKIALHTNGYNLNTYRGYLSGDDLYLYSLCECIRFNHHLDECFYKTCLCCSHTIFCYDCYNKKQN